MTTDVSRRAVALLPARGGSKGLPGKNIKPLAGKPLIAWTIEAARQSLAVERIVVSTDDEAIMACARDWGAEVPFRRPQSLASDTAEAVDVALHFLDWLATDLGGLPSWLVLLQPTSPLRRAADIDGALSLAMARDADAVIAVCPARPHPYWSKSLDEEGRLRAWLPETMSVVQRQALPPLYVPNGAVYGIRPEVLRAARTFAPANTVAWIMPESRSIDIDSAWDFLLADFVLGNPHAAV